jgi:hypothetical protein
MGLDDSQLETVKKAGGSVAQVARKYAGELYKIDRSRNASELLDALRSVCRRIVSMDTAEREYLSPSSIEKLTEMIHQYADERGVLKDIKNTLVIYSAMAFARSKYFEETKEAGGNE